jgi:uncharacterized coiled-coil DUF342 family protein
MKTANESVQGFAEELENMTIEAQEFTLNFKEAKQSLNKEIETLTSKRDTLQKEADEVERFIAVLNETHTAEKTKLDTEIQEKKSELEDILNKCESALLELHEEKQKIQDEVENLSGILKTLKVQKAKEDLYATAESDNSR